MRRAVRRAAGEQRRRATHRGAAAVELLRRHAWPLRCSPSSQGWPRATLLRPWGRRQLARRARARGRWLGALAKGLAKLGGAQGLLRAAGRCWRRPGPRRPCSRQADKQGCGAGACRLLPACQRMSRGDAAGNGLECCEFRPPPRVCRVASRPCRPILSPLAAIPPSRHCRDHRNIVQRACAQQRAAHFVCGPAALFSRPLPLLLAPTSGPCTRPGTRPAPWPVPREQWSRRSSRSRQKTVSRPLGPL